jgi:hypothetical protein
MKISRKRVERLATDGLLAELGPAGFVELEPGVIVRLRNGWREGMFVQTSSPRSNQMICIKAGVDVPEAVRSVSDGALPPFGVACGGAVSDRGIGQGDMWLRAETAEDVRAAVSKVLSLLKENAGWFKQFRDVRDVAQAVFESRSLLPLGQNDYWKQLAVFHYARMLLAAGDRPGAVDWLRETDRVIRSGERLDKDDQAVLAQVAALLQGLN